MLEPGDGYASNSKKKNFNIPREKNIYYVTVIRFQTIRHLYLENFTIKSVVVNLSDILLSGLYLFKTQTCTLVLR